jgi:hypothetical protein
MDVRELLALGEGDRLARIADGRPGQWLQWYLAIDAVIRDAARHERREWLSLKLWLIRRGRAVFTRSESAIQLAAFVARLEPGDDLPAGDEVVQACLDAIPVGIDEVARGDPMRMGIQQQRLSRRARGLVRMAEPHLARVRDRQLADRLRRWIEIAPELA